MNRERGGGGGVESITMTPTMISANRKNNQQKVELF